MPQNELYQFSLLNALMDGVASHGLPCRTLSHHGTIGLGTFHKMDGEMIMLNSKTYQLKSGGDVRLADPDTPIPFAVVTNFSPEKKVDDLSLKVKGDLEKVLGDLCPGTKNLYLAFTVRGVFGRVKARTVKGQEYPGERLSELGKKQSVEVYEDVKGTVVGFRTPENWQGFGVAGLHLHFVDDERAKGGHVLELEGKYLGLEVAVISRVVMDLPRTEEFNAASLVTDREGVKGVEG
ncbi:alpha-acetolactate decarboxylase [Piedraia hortae CBS 480.64]|uniref:Alpha-acetolactate decarboxylase n=1 Tax=Piedraia hortae CBS 480.64 TaxID=1314780 RepID=A0A6A7BXA0_9PEZI|nr:alpha-acetolactate decarboxylase [Piedraia hortae CBS 480.64]